MGSCFVGDQALPRGPFCPSASTNFATRQREVIHYLKQLQVPELTLPANDLFRRRLKAYYEAH